MNNPFSANAISLAMANVASSTLLLQIYSQCILNQPEVSLDAIPAFNLDQKSVQQTSLYCIENVAAPLVASLAANDIGFANLYEASYDKLLTQAQIIEDMSNSLETRKAATVIFCEGIENLIANITSSKSIVLSNLGILTQFIDMTASNQTSLDADLEIAQKQLVDGDIATLKAKLNTIQNKIDADNQTIASGAVYGLVAAINISVGILIGWYDDPSKGVKIIVGEIEGIVTDSQEHSDAMADLKVQMEAYITTLTDLLYDEAIYVVVQNLAFNTDLLAAHAKSMLSTLQSYIDGWDILSESLSDINNTLKNAPTATLQLSASLQAAQSEWSLLLNQAKEIQAMGIVPVTVSDVTN